MKQYIYFIKFLTLSVFLICSSSLYAQDKVNFFEGAISYVVPTGSFSQNIKSNKVGFELAFLRQITSDKPFFWGISTYYTNLGSCNAITKEAIDFAIYDINSTTNSNLLGVDGKLRYYPDIYLGRIEVYVEALMGFKWLFTYTHKEFVGDSDSSSGQFEEGQLALSYGVNLGIQYPIGQSIYINLKGGFYPGLSVPYYAYNSQNKIIDYTLDKFDLKRSTTDLIRYDLGVTYRF